VTREQISAIGAAVKRMHGLCLPRDMALMEVLRDYPDIDVREMRAVSMMVDRAPFPSIEGSPPLDRARPYFDARWWARFKRR
jgi:hypothetical protein